MPSLLRKGNMLHVMLFSKKRKKRKMNDAMPLTRCSKNLFECKIDELPDELLVVILSCLNLDEAVRTSMLSRRWRYLWKYTTCNNIQLYNEDTWKFEAAEKFINSVNQALKFHQGECIEQFKVGFVYPSTDYLLNRDTEFARDRRSKVNLHIDGWINFAMAKQVKVFELNMGAGTHEDTGLRRNYSIRHVQKLLSISGEINLLSRKCWDWIPDEHPQLCNLKELELDINLEEDEGLCFYAFLIMCSPQLSRVTIKLSFFGGASRWVGKYFEHNHLVRRMKQQRNIVGSNCEIEEVPRSLIHWVGKHLLELRAADNAAREATRFHHQCLEVVKLVGFIGCLSDTVFALHLLRIAPSLQKMIIDSEVKDPHISPLYNKKAIRKCVEQLNANLPAGAELLTSGPGFMEES